MSTFDIGLWDNGSGTFDVALVGTLDATVPNTRTPVVAVAGVTTPAYVGPPDASIDLRTSAAFTFINKVGVADVGGYVSTYVPSGTAVGDLLIAVYSGSLGSNLATWASIGSTGFRYKVATGTDLTTLFDATDEISSAVIGIWTFRNQGASPIETSALGSTSAGPYVAPSVTAASASDVWLVLLGLNNGSANVSSGFTSDGFVGGDIVSTYGIFHKQLTASGATGTASFTSNGGYNGNASSVIVTSGGVGGLNIKVAATASIPAPTVSANSTVPASLVPAVVAIANAHPPISAPVLPAVAAIELPTVTTQTNATITAVLITATTTIPEAHPPISAALVTATTTQPRPAFNTTTTAALVSGVASVIRPTFDVTITATAVTAVSALAGSVVSPGPTTVAAVATPVRPAFNVSITAALVATTTAIAQPQSPATVTATVVLATAAVTTERPAIATTKVSAVTAIALPQSPATVTATAVPAVSSVIRPAFNVTITGLTATTATATLTGYAASASSTVTASATSSTAATPAATVHLYKMGAYKPNVLYTLTNLTGSYTDIDDSPDTPDANALVPTGGAIVVRMGFENHRTPNSVVNGDGSSGDITNWSGAQSPTYVAGDGPPETSGYFLGVAGMQYWFYATNQRFSVDLSKTYALSIWLKQFGSSTTSTAFLSMDAFDADGLEIQSVHTMWSPDTDTALAADLHPGDTVVHLTNSYGWVNSGMAYMRHIAIYGYQNSHGFTYPDYSYTRWIVSEGDPNGAYADGAIAGNDITLNTPFPSTWGTIPAGTAVSNAHYGSTFLYPASPQGVFPVYNSWQQFSGHIQGVYTDGQEGRLPLAQFRPGTVSVNVGVLLDAPPDYTNSHMAFGGVYFAEYQALMRAEAGDQKFRVVVKVP